MNETATVKVLFVCMGNICRSPTAEGVFRKLVEDAGLSERIEIDSAGTHAYHVDEPPDSRAQETALRPRHLHGGPARPPHQARRLRAIRLHPGHGPGQLPQLVRTSARRRHERRLSSFSPWTTPPTSAPARSPTPTTAVPPVSSASSTWSRPPPTDCSRTSSDSISGTDERFGHRLDHAGPIAGSRSPQGSIPQIRCAYSVTDRSLENGPIRATLQIAIRVQRSRSRQQRSTSSWAAR